eukprot:GHRR01011356.1.p2 GENE.GHRR01011356.1~~GHRR01011356.1.p2  ORF type:complete len:353 (+),score=170.04 GHRR01011356.1:240-1298(+)
MLAAATGSRLLQQCGASQCAWLGCCWWTAASLATNAAANAAEAANVIQPLGQSAASSRQQGQPIMRPGVSDSLLRLSFQQLHDDMQKHLVLQLPQAESKLLALIDKAADANQLQAAVSLVRLNYMKHNREAATAVVRTHHTRPSTQRKDKQLQLDRVKRSWVQQVQPVSAQVTNALYEACQRCSVGHNFGLQMLEQANLLGLHISRSFCEQVIQACLKQQDYPAAALAWAYSQVHCTTGSSQQGQQQQPQHPIDQQQQLQSSASWASKSMVRLYLNGMTQWLAQGGPSERQQQRLRSELQHLAHELESRGGKIRKELTGLLQVQDSGAAFTDAGATATPSAASDASDASVSA